MPDPLLTFAYSTAYEPPMPVVDLGLSNPDATTAARTVVALVDSGSDGTLIPLDILESVGALPVDEARLRGFLGDSRLVVVYLVTLYVGPYIIHGVRAVAVEEDAEIILGRDVLNQLVVTLNGLASVTEITT